MECIDAADFFIVSFDGLRAAICTAKLEVLAHQWPRTDNRDTTTSESVWTRISIERTQSRVRADVSFNGFNVGSIGWRRQNTQLFTAHCISQQRRTNGLSEEVDLQLAPLLRRGGATAGALVLGDATPGQDHQPPLGHQREVVVSRQLLLQPDGNIGKQRP